MPIGAIGLLAGAAAAQGVGSLVGGALEARAAKKSFSDVEEERLRRLERLRAAGKLGLTNAGRVATREEMLANAAPELLAQQAQTRQMQAAAGGMTGRDVLLASSQAQNAKMQQAQAISRAIADEDRAKKAEQLKELGDLSAQEDAARSARAAAIARAFGGVGSAAMGAAQTLAPQVEESGGLKTAAFTRAAQAASGPSLSNSSTFLLSNQSRYNFTF